MRIRILIVAFLAVIVPGLSVPGDESEDASKFENLVGWSWIIPPVPIEHEDDPQVAAGGGMVLLTEEGKDEELVVVFARSGAIPMNGFYGWRPVAFDKQRRRRVLWPRIAAGTLVPESENGIMLERYGSDPKVLPASQVFHVGLEGFTREGVRLRAQDAARRARKQKLAVLPFPVVGQKYAFELTDLSGQTIDSQNLRGKVIVLDLWATWCLPCMEKMPKLKALHEQWHAAGLEIMGINFDESAGACVKATKDLELPWKQSMAPTDEKLRDLWMEAIGGGGLPRLLVIDRTGSLHADCRPSELEDLVRDLMKTTPNR